MPTALRSAAGASGEAGLGGVLPAQVTGFAVATNSAIQETLTWDAAAGADAYRVEYSLDAGANWSLAPDGLVLASPYVATPLNSGTQYWWRVRGSSSGGAGFWSATRSAWTLPGQVTGLNATAVSASEIDLTCDAQSPVPGSGYDWYISTNNVTFTLKATTAGPAFNDASGLLASTLYYYKVRSRNPAGVGAFSNVDSDTTQAGSNTLSVSLTAAYDFEGNGTDGTGRGNTATLNSSPATVAGKVGNALYCTGGSNITIPDSADTRIGGGLDWTLVFWVKPDSVAVGTEWWAEKGDPNSGSSHEFYIQRVAGNVFFYVNGSLTVASTTGSELVAGEWNFVRARYTASMGTLELRVNQAGAYSQVVGAITAQAQQTRIGKISGNNASSAFDCWKLWHRALSDTECQFEANAYQGRSVAETLVASPVAVATISTVTLATAAGSTFVGFTDLIWDSTRSKWFACWREAAVHTYTSTGKIRVASSPDFVTWTNIALLSSPHSTHDLAGAFFAVRPSDSRLLLLAISRTTTVYQPMLFTSDDGTTWDTGTDCVVPTANDWLWRFRADPVSGHFYSIGYPALVAGNPRLYTSTDGVTWTTVVDPVISEVVNETDLCFLADGKLVCLGRKDQSTSDRWGIAAASPWSFWTWRNTIPTLPAAAHDSQYESPVLAPVRPDGSIFAAGRIAVSDSPGGQRTSFAFASSPLRALEEVIAFGAPLGTGSESGYPGLVVKPDEPGYIYCTHYQGPASTAFVVIATKIRLPRY